MKKLIIILFLLLAMTAFSQVTTTPLTRQFLTNYTEWRALGRLGPETNITSLIKTQQMSGTGTTLGPVTSWTEEVILVAPDSSNITANSHVDFGAFTSMAYHSTNRLSAGWYRINFLRLLGDQSAGDACDFLCSGTAITPFATINTQWVESVFFAQTNNSFITANIIIQSATHAGFTNLTIQPMIFARSNVYGFANEYSVGSFDNLYAANITSGTQGVTIQPLNIIAGTNMSRSVTTNLGVVNVTLDATNASPVAQYTLATYGNVTNYNANFGYSEQKLIAANDIYFANSSNKMASTVRNISIVIENYSGANRALAFNASWKWLGTTYNPPTTITNGKTAILAIKAYGLDETNVVAAFAVSP